MLPNTVLKHNLQEDSNMSKDTKNNTFEEDDELDQITITLEDDTELVCDVICIFEYKDRDYVCLLPEDDPDGDFLFYRFSETEDGECDLDNIVSDDEFEEVADYFEEMCDDAAFQDALDSLDDEDEE